MELSVFHGCCIVPASRFCKEFGISLRQRKKFFFGCNVLLSLQLPTIKRVQPLAILYCSLQYSHCSTVDRYKPYVFVRLWDTSVFSFFASKEVSSHRHLIFCWNRKFWWCVLFLCSWHHFLYLSFFLVMGTSTNLRGMPKFMGIM